MAKRVVHFQREDVYRTLDGDGGGGPVFPKPPSTPSLPKPPTTGPSGPTPPSGPTFPSFPTPPTFTEPTTPGSGGGGFQPLWPTTTRYNFDQPSSIASDTIDPFKTTILPDWFILVMPFEAGQAARWRQGITGGKYFDVPAGTSAVAGIISKIEKSPWFDW